MNDCENLYERICGKEFAKLHAKLDQLDEAIRGNGKPGVQRRLDRLEASEASRNRLIWIITGSAVTLATTTLWQRIFGG